jgi:hypothetical protein
MASTARAAASSEGSAVSPLGLAPDVGGLPDLASAADRGTWTVALHDRQVAACCALVSKVDPQCRQVTKVIKHIMEPTTGLRGEGA